ncbi:MAG: hypothetical protein ACO2PO_22730 [Candidatus Calescibacterium sp.]
MTEKEKRDLLGEYRSKVTGEERLKVTISMPLWMKVFIWKESKEKGIPVWEYLAKVLQESQENERLKQENELLRRENEELKNENEVLRKVSGSDYSVIKYEKLKEYIRKILKDMIEYCGECARGVLLKYKGLRIVGVEEMIDEVLK